MSARGQTVSLDDSLMPNMQRIAKSRALSTLFNGFSQKSIFYDQIKQGKLSSKSNKLA